MSSLNLIAVAIAFFGTLAVLYVLNFMAPRMRLVDHPDDDRKRHDGQIPLTGGLGILIALIPALFVLGLDSGALGLPADFFTVLSILLGTLVIGHAIDDVFELSATIRLSMDAALALLISTLALVSITNLGDLFGMGVVTLGRWSIVMTIFAFIAASNAFNMTDGIDGLCSGLGILACLALIMMFSMTGIPLAEPLIMMIAVVVAAMLAAYVANLGYLGAHMKTFLGDSGARLIGFVIAMIIIYGAEHGLIKPVLVFFPIAVPVCDCLILMAIRTAHRRSPFSADRLHLHHLLQDTGFSHAHARYLILLLGAVFAGIGMVLQAWQLAEWIVSIIVVGLFASYIVFRLWLQHHITVNVEPIAANGDSWSI